MPDSVKLAALLALALLVAPAAGNDDAADPAAREWTQVRGNAGRSASSSVAPLGGEPVDAWKQPLPGTALGEPVTWGGVVFVAVQKDKSRRLLAFRVATGEPIGSQELGSGTGRLALATWQGVVMVLEPEQIRTFKHQGTKFNSAWSARGKFSAPPCIWLGYCFVCDGADLVCLDVIGGGSKKAKSPVVDTATYKNVAEMKGVTGDPVGGAVGVFRNKQDGVLYAVNVATVGSAALFSRTRVDDLTGKAQMRYTQTWGLGTCDGAIADTDRWDMIPCRIDGEGDKGPGAWVVLASPSRLFAGGGAGKFVSDVADAKPLNLVTPPAVAGTTLFSFAQNGDLQTWRANGQTETLIAAADAPKGSKPGPATRAGSVVFLGSFAVDVAERHTIWSLKHVPVTPLIPAGDKRLVFATKDDLVCVADASVAAESPSAAAAGSAPAGATGGAKTPDAAPMKVPGDAEGVLLADGRQFEGTFERSGHGKIVIHPKGGGEAVEVSSADVVVAEAGGKVEIRGDDAAAFKVWRGSVRGAYCDAMEAVFQDYAKANLLDDARRVMQRMRDAGASEARQQRLDASLNGKQPRTDAPRAKKLAAQEETARAALLEGLSRGVDWCKRRGLPTAATAILSELGRQKGGVDADLETRAKTLVPDGFPWRDAPDAAKQWMVWADVLLPAGGEFLASDDGAWGRLTNEPWSKQKPLGFRTRNLILFCMDEDMAVCKLALQMGEGGVRAVQALLNDGEAEEVGGDKDRLEVRIHTNRKAYLEEKTPLGKAPEWSGGNFNPADNISRFYVERGSSKDGKPDLAELGRVLTHELTHHYMEVRWMQHQGAGGGAGYWVIEGMARFVEDQAVGMERRGLSFNDESVAALDALSTIEKQPNTLFKSERFVDMSHGDFDTLGNNFLMKVKLRNTFGDKGYTERGLWYDQAGALTFFFLHKRGPEGRKSFVEYVRMHYQGRAPTPGWSFLGYESAEALDKDFTAFLRGLRGG